jgi:hypothetical protein
LALTGVTIVLTPLTPDPADPRRRAIAAAGFGAVLLSLAELLVLAQNDDDLPEPALALGSPRGSLWSQGLTARTGADVFR